MIMMLLLKLVELLAEGGIVLPVQETIQNLRQDRATVMGTIKELGNGSDGIEGTPVIENVELLDEDVECEVESLPPLCSLDDSPSLRSAASGSYSMGAWLAGAALAMNIYGL